MWFALHAHQYKATCRIHEFHLESNSICRSLTICMSLRHRTEHLNTRGPRAELLDGKSSTLGHHMSPHAKAKEPEESVKGAMKNLRRND